MKNINRLFIILFTILLICYPISVQASTKIKISNSKLTLNVGQTRKLSVSGLTSNDKVKWKSSNKKIATVSSKGKVTAASEGTAKITATVNKKSYICTVTVKPRILSEAEKVKNVSYETYTTDNSLVVSLKNNNVKSTSDILVIRVSASFYDESDKLIYKSVADSTHYQVASGKEFLSVFELPRENNYPHNKIDFASYRIDIDSTGVSIYKLDLFDKIDIKENVVDYSNYFEVSTRDGKEYYRNISEEVYNSDPSLTTIKDSRKRFELIIDNNSEDIIDLLNIYVVYYKDNQIVALDEYTGELNIEQITLQKQNDYILDADNNYYGFRSSFESKDKYDNYKILVNHAYVRY